MEQKKLKCLSRMGLNSGSVDSKNARKQERWKSTGMGQGQTWNGRGVNLDQSAAGARSKNAGIDRNNKGESWDAWNYVDVKIK